MTCRKVAIVVDNRGWFDPHAAALVERLGDNGCDAQFVTRQKDVPVGDIAFYLSCVRITPPAVLKRNARNVVVHASALPKGRGFSPIVWQILEGAHDIPVTMIEMAEEVDAGDILMQRTLHFEGHELNDELRTALGECIVEMCLDYVANPDAYPPRPQTGTPSWYSRRRPDDSRLDPSRSIEAQFDLLRVVDNEAYPAFFDMRGHRYILKIEKVGPAPAETETTVTPKAKEKPEEDA